MWQYCPQPWPINHGIQPVWLRSLRFRTCLTGNGTGESRSLRECQRGSKLEVQENIESATSLNDRRRRYLHRKKCKTFARSDQFITIELYSKKDLFVVGSEWPLAWLVSWTVLEKTWATESRDILGVWGKHGWLTMAQWWTIIQISPLQFKDIYIILTCLREGHFKIWHTSIR